MLANTTYSLTRYWCHNCRRPFLLDPSTGSFTCVNCYSELIEELNGSPDDPRQFQPQRDNVRTREVPIVYTVYTTTVYEPMSVDLDRRIEAILNFINGHTGVHMGVQPASQAQITSLPVPSAGEVAGKDCPVCQEDLHAEDCTRRMPCGHMYHQDCLSRWLHIHNSCPVCRAPISGAPSAAVPSCHI